MAAAAAAAPGPSMPKGFAGLQSLNVSTDPLGKTLFPDHKPKDGVDLKKNSLFFGVVRVNGEKTFTVYDNIMDKIYSYVFESHYMNHIIDRCVDLMNIGFAFEMPPLTTENLKRIVQGIYVDSASPAEYKSTYVCYLLGTGTDGIPIVISTCIIVIMKDNTCHLWNLITNPLYSGGGYGSRFLKQIKTLLFNNGIRSIGLSVLISSFPFMSFEERLVYYLKQGFHITPKNEKPNIKILFANNRELQILGMSPKDEINCVLSYVEGGRVNKIPISYRNLEETLISVIDKRIPIVGGLHLTTKTMKWPVRCGPKPLVRKIFNSHQNKAEYSALFHGLIMNKNYADGSIKSFKVPPNVELVCVNQIGSYLYPYQWILFLMMYNRFNFSEIPAEVLQLLFPKIRTRELIDSAGNKTDEIILPSLATGLKEVIQVIKSFGSSVVFHGNTGDVYNNRFTVKVYPPGDTCPIASLSMLIHTAGGRNLDVYDPVFRIGGLRESNSDKTLYEPPPNLKDPERLVSTDRVLPSPAQIRAFTNFGADGEQVNPSYYINPKIELPELIEKAVAHAKSVRDDEDPPQIVRIVVGCCGKLSGDFSPGLLEQQELAMFKPSYEPLLRVPYRSINELETLLTNFGKIIDRFSRSLTYKELLLTETETARDSEIKRMALQRLQMMLETLSLPPDAAAGGGGAAAAAAGGSAFTSRKIRKNKTINNRKHLNKTKRNKFKRKKRNQVKK